MLLLGGLAVVNAVKCHQQTSPGNCTQASYCQYSASSCRAVCSLLSNQPSLCVDNQCDYLPNTQTCIAAQFQQTITQDVFCYRYDTASECLKWANSLQQCEWSEEQRACVKQDGGEESPVPEHPPAATPRPTQLAVPTLYPTTPYPTMFTLPPTTSAPECGQFVLETECIQTSDCVFFNGVCLPKSAVATDTTNSLHKRAFNVEIDYWIVVASVVCVLGVGAWIAMPPKRHFRHVAVIRLFQVALLVASLVFFCLASRTLDIALVAYTAAGVTVLFIQMLSNSTLSRCALESGFFFSTPVIAMSIDVHSPLLLSGGIMLEFALGVLSIAAVLFFQLENGVIASEFKRDLLEFSFRMLSALFGVLLLIDGYEALTSAQLICSLALQLVCVMLVALPMFQGKLKFGLDVIGITMAIVVGQGWYSLCMIYLWGAAIGMAVDKPKKKPEVPVGGKETTTTTNNVLSPQRTKVFPPPSSSSYSSPATTVKKPGGESSSAQRRLTASERRRNRPVTPHDPPFDPQLANV
ncbi:hypothetical protein BASA81_001950 [Batrachochytrium salamandrivorans]|nr:hypothetical protein BASA81_001950 [Batrachochytrium salamandrivorans]